MRRQRSTKLFSCASSHIYKSTCLSVGPLVGWSICLLVCHAFVKTTHADYGFFHSFIRLQLLSFFHFLASSHSYSFIHSLIYSLIHSFIHYHIFLRLGLIELGKGAGIHVSSHFIHYHIHLRLGG